MKTYYQNHATPEASPLSQEAQHIEPVAPADHLPEFAHPHRRSVAIALASSERPTAPTRCNIDLYPSDPNRSPHLKSTGLSSLRKSIKAGGLAKENH